MRLAVPQPARAASKIVSVPAPVHGLVYSAAVAKSDPLGAEVLENWFPTQRGIRIRGGLEHSASLSAGVKSFMGYRTGSTRKLFAADASAIYEVTSFTGSTMTAAVTGQSNGAWMAQQIGTAGGDYLLAFNGEDDGQIYDGSSWAALGTSITGVSGSALVAPWIFGSRMWAIEAGTLNAWYWPVDSIGGALQSFSLAGVFQQGGELVFGCAWSSDAGAADGIRYFDHCVFMSSEGEIATYRGSYTAVDPSTPGDWILTGRYNVAPPLGRKCHIKAGGDVAIATVAGVVPMSAITSKDPAALAMSAVSRPIDPLWKQLYSDGAQVEFIKWTENAVGLITSPGNAKVLSVNLQTGAWAQQTGWDASCLISFNGQAYMGRSDGKILALDVTGADDGVPFTAQYCGSFHDLGSAAQYKITNMVRGTFFAGSNFKAKPGISVDYNIAFGDPPVYVMEDVSVYLRWDVSNWDEALWYSSSIELPTITEVTRWQAVSATGYTMAPTWMVTSGGETKLNLELTRTDLSIEAGGTVV